jgi:hypothetical protein
MTLKTQIRNILVNERGYTQGPGTKTYEVTYAEGAPDMAYDKEKGFYPIRHKAGDTMKFYGAPLDPATESVGTETVDEHGNTHRILSVSASPLEKAVTWNGWFDLDLEDERICVAYWDPQQAAFQDMKALLDATPFREFYSITQGDFVLIDIPFDMDDATASAVLEFVESVEALFWGFPMPVYGDVCEDGTVDFDDVSYNLVEYKRPGSASR